VSRRYEFLEHTADLGIRAWGSSVEELFAGAAEALAEVLGAWFPGEGRERVVEVEAPDQEALLVAWLDELLYLHEADDVVFGGFDVDRVDARRLRARVRAGPRGVRELESPGVKATTYHRLRLAREEEMWVADVYLDL
jgi:SHS2 domain-containing protein